MMNPLFSAITVGPYRLKHGVVMAPMTRLRSGAGGVPGELMAKYYAQRATDGGLIISEASPVSRNAYGYAHAPGIYTQAQVEGWRNVVAGVHGKGGRMFLHLWHAGRQSHASLQPGGGAAVAPSAIQAQGEAYGNAGP